MRAITLVWITCLLLPLARLESQQDSLRSSRDSLRVSHVCVLGGRNAAPCSGIGPESRLEGRFVWRTEDSLAIIGGVDGSQIVLPTWLITKVEIYQGEKPRGQVLELMATRAVLGALFCGAVMYGVARLSEDAFEGIPGRSTQNSGEAFIQGAIGGAVAGVLAGYLVSRQPVADWREAPYGQLEITPVVTPNRIGVLASVRF